jgi:outer membrane protein insertion porin family
MSFSFDLICEFKAFLNGLADFRRWIFSPHDSTRRKLRGIFTPAFFLLLLGLCGKPVESGETDSALFGKPVRRIEITPETLNPSHYVPYLGIKTGDSLTRTAVKGAIQFLYECGRFSQIDVEALPEGDGVLLRFNLQQNYYFNKFSIKGKVDLKGHTLGEWASMPIGKQFTQEKLEEAERAVLKFMREKGFYLAKVKAKQTLDDKTRLVNTIFEVQPGSLAVIEAIDDPAGLPLRESEEISKILGYRAGRSYDRSRLNARLENLRKYLLKKGYLSAIAQVSETFDPDRNRVTLALRVTHFGKIRVVVEGIKIDKNQLRKLLPILNGEEIDARALGEGAKNLKDYLENMGYSEADVKINETVDDFGVRVLHHQVIPNRKFTVAHVRFKGNEALTDGELSASVMIQRANLFQNTGYSAIQLDDDVDALKALYESRGYLQAVVIPLVEPAQENQSLDITFLCREGPLSRTGSVNLSGNKAISVDGKGKLLPTGSLTLSGNKGISNKELEFHMRLLTGKAYSPSRAEQDRQAILAAYNDLGFLQTQVKVHESSPDKENSYPIEFQIQEGTQSRVDRIIILGNERTSLSRIQKKIKLEEGEPLSLGKLLQTQRGLYDLGVFDQVRVAAQIADSGAPYQDVVVRLQESRRYTIRYGFGYQEREKFRGTLELTDSNFLGFARRANIRFRASSIEQQALFNLQQPHFRALPVESYLTFSALQRRDVSFDSRRFSASFQFSHPFGNHNWGMLRYNFKNVRVFNAQVPISDLGREDEPVNLSTFSAAFINDTRDDYLDPSKGFFSSTDLGITTKLLGDNNYISFFSQNSYFRKLSSSFFLAASMRLGLANPYGGDRDLPISERFFAGGGSSLRGFETDYAGPLQANKPVGGNALIVGSLEMRVPVVSFVRLAGFYDTGNVFREIGDIHFSDFSHTLGIGLRIKTPFGPLRADYGYNLHFSSALQQNGLKRGHLFITVGPPF